VQRGYQSCRRWIAVHSQPSKAVLSRAASRLAQSRGDVLVVLLLPAALVDGDDDDDEVLGMIVVVSPSLLTVETLNDETEQRRWRHGAAVRNIPPAVERRNLKGKVIHNIQPERMCDDECLWEGRSRLGISMPLNRRSIDDDHATW
jgi:hypothetical protein